MAAEAQSIRLRIDADARLAAAAGGAARYFGDAAGLEDGPLADLQAAIVSACLEGFQHLTQADPHLEVTLTRRADRIEVALSHKTPEGSREGPPAKNLLGIDRVQHETRGGAEITLLTKYVEQRNARR